MSEVRVNKLSPRSGTTVTLGDSGDTISIPSGVTFSNAGTNTFASATITGDLTVDTNTLYIDSTNNRVGIGTTSPSTKLHVYSGNSGVTPNGNADDLFIENNGAAGITIGSSVNEKGNIFFADSGNALDGYIQYAHDTRYLRFATATLERMRIDSSGNVGIGTSSPDRPLTVKEVSNVAISVIKSSGQDILHIGEYGGGGEATYNSILNGSHIFLDNGTEHMRIDSSGNVLVGKTSSSSSTAGAEFRPAGVSIFGRDGNTPVLVNRNTNDGTLISFRKGGTEVGSIGVTASGASISLGGNAAANKLDDYEEGTWTPTDASGAGLTFASSSGQYVKIGKMVYLGGNINYPGNGDSSTMLIGGLPFTCANIGSADQYGVAVVSTNVGANHLFRIQKNTTNILPRTNTNTVIANSVYSSKFFQFFGQYQTT